MTSVSAKERLTIRQAPTGRGTTWGLVTLTFSLLMALASCGPSIQSIHEGSVRFEHCYRLDLDARIVSAHRHACWEQWLRVYSYGQSRDRLEHARARVRELEAGDPHPPRLDLESQQERQARQFYMSTPGPINVHAPPPPVAAPASETHVLAPEDTCIVACRNARNACLARCQPGPEGEAKSRNDTEPVKPAETQADEPQGSENVTEESNDSECDCEQDYKVCGARCFK